MIRMLQARHRSQAGHNQGMNIVILDDYQDAVRKLNCAARLDPFSAKVYTNTVKGLGQLSVRLKDAEVIVLIRERTHITRKLIEKLPDGTGGQPYRCRRLHRERYCGGRRRRFAGRAC